VRRVQCNYSGASNAIAASIAPQTARAAEASNANRGLTIDCS
jgi:hypothetical protein